MKISKKLIIAKCINIFFSICYFFKFQNLVKSYLEIYISKGNSSKRVLYLSPERSHYEIKFLIKNKISLFLPSKLLTNEILIFCGYENNVNINYKNVKLNEKKVHFFSEIFNKINLGLIITPAYHYNYDNLFAC